MNTSINLIKSSLMTGLAVYGGKILGQSLVKKFVLDKLSTSVNDKTKNYSHFLKDPVILSSLITLGIIISPVPVSSLKLKVLGCGLGIIFGGISEFLKNNQKNNQGNAGSENKDKTSQKSHDEHSNTQNQGDTGSENKDKTNQQPPEKQDDTQKPLLNDVPWVFPSVEKQTKETQEREELKKPCLLQYQELNNDEKIAYNKFTEEMGIDNSKLYFDITLTAQYAVKYYTAYHELTTSGQENFKECTKKYIEDIIQIIRDLDETIMVVDFKYQEYLDALNYRDNRYLKALAEHHVINSTKETHKSLKELLKNFLFNVHARKGLFKLLEI